MVRKEHGGGLAFAEAPPIGGASPAPPALKPRVRAGCRLVAAGYWRDGHGNSVENFDPIEDAARAGNLASLLLSVDDAIRVCAAYFAERKATAK